MACGARWKTQFCNENHEAPGFCEAKMTPAKKISFL